MNFTKNLILTVLFCTLVGVVGINCGGGEAADTDSDTGTVVLKGSNGSGEDGSSLMSFLTTNSLTDAAYMRLYKVTLYESADCTGDSIDIFDESDDTSDCVDQPTEDELDEFRDLSGTPTFATAEITEGDYNCMAVTMCDQINWESSDLAECTGENFLDVAGDRETVEAEVATYYWSTTGDADGGGCGELEEGEECEDDGGTIGDPFSFSGLSVESGSTTEVTMTLDNSEAVGEDAAGLYGTYDDEAPEEDACSMFAPAITFE